MSKAILALLAASLGLLFADHSLLAPNLTAAALDLDLDAGERDLRLGGLLSFLTTAMAALGALVAGPLADRRPRLPLYIGAITLAELACLAVLVAETWIQLAVLRAATGFGLGAAVPVIFSLASDLAPRRRLGFSMGVLWTALGAGIVIGVVVAGQLGPIHGWRVPFAAVALPNLLLAAVLVFAVPEPPRRGASADGGPTTMVRGIRRVFALPVNRWLYIEEVFEVLPFAVIATFLPDFLAQERGFSVRQASWVMAAFGAAAIVGKLIGGHVGDLGLRRGAWTLPSAAAASLVAAVPLAWAVLGSTGSTDSGAPWTAIMLAAAVGLTAPLPKPLHTALLIEHNAAEVRGTALAWHRLAANLGQAAGPLAAAAAIAAWGRRVALETTFVSWLVAALCLAPVAWLLRRRPVPDRASA